MYVQIPPVFYSTLSPFGAEALLTQIATLDKPVSRARVPETISCLWATGFWDDVKSRPHLISFWLETINKFRSVSASSPNGKASYRETRDMVYIKRLKLGSKRPEPDTGCCTPRHLKALLRYQMLQLASGFWFRLRVAWVNLLESPTSLSIQGFKIEMSAKES